VKAAQARVGWLGLAILLVVGITYAAIRAGAAIGAAPSAGS